MLKLGFSTPVFELGRHGPSCIVGQSIDRPYFYLLPVYIWACDISLTVVELFSWLQKPFRLSSRPSDPDTMTIRPTSLEAFDSWRDKTANE